MDTARELFREYEAWLGLDLCFQGFEEELAGLPGKYAPPAGRLLLAFCETDAAGCVAMRRLEPGVCEMKRLYLRPAFRGGGGGRHLVRAVLDAALDAGYTAMRLDTYPERMQRAVDLYSSMGFVPIEPYYDNPHTGVLFMERSLKR